MHGDALAGCQIPGSGEAVQALAWAHANRFVLPCHAACACPVEKGRIINSVTTLTVDYGWNIFRDMTRHVFLSKQWYEWANLNDHIHLTKDDFKLKQVFDLLPEPLDEFYKEHFLRIWCRRAPIE